MRLDGRRESENVEDRRGMSGATKAGLGGIGAVIIAAIIAFISGGDPISVITNSATQIGTQTSQSDGEYQPTPEEEEFARFTKQILAGTEDVWTKVFNNMGKTYRPPTLVLFTGAVNSGCGNATASVGPFYCSADEKLYIDLSFFKQMRDQMGAGGDFAYAYVVGHEVGHHVQHLLGTLDAAHQKMSRLSEKEANKVSVRIELQADFYAGIWGYYDNQIYNSLEDGDIEEALNCATKIGDDYLQKQAQGYAVPESFNHGTSRQREKWLKRGLSTGDMSKGNTFDYSDSQL